MRKTYKNPFMPSKAELDLRQAIKDYKIWFHMLEYGEPVDDGFHAILKMATALYPAIKDRQESAALAEGIRIFKEATEFNSWRKSYTKPVNTAMDIILKRFPTAPKDIAINAVYQALEATCTS